MAKERLKSPRARLFVALDLPKWVREGIAGWGREALCDPALRPVAEENLHITLAFLGYLAEKEIPRLAEIVTTGPLPAPLIELRGPVARPRRGQPRFIALPVESSGVLALQTDLRSRLVEARLYEPEKRPFWPHVTVARMRRQGRGSTQPTPVSGLPEELPNDLLQPFDGVRMTLYLSQLQPWGAQYTSLAQVKLPTGRR